MLVQLLHRFLDLGEEPTKPFDQSAFEGLQSRIDNIVPAKEA